MSVENAVMAVQGRLIYPKMLLPMGWQQDWPLAPINSASPRFAICHIRSGSAVFVVAGQALLVAAPAVLILDDLIRPDVHQASSLEMEAIYFHPNMLNSLFSIESMHSVEIRRAQFGESVMRDFYLLERFVKAAPSERVLPLPPAVRERVVAAWLGTVTQAQLQMDKHWPCRTRSYLIELLFQLRMLEPNPAAVQVAGSDTPPVISKIHRALQFVQENYQTDFTVAELARHCGSNRTTLNTEFRILTGKTVRAYTIGLRMQMAAALLRDTLLPVGEIMARVGYENQSHFTRAFRQLTGVSPAAYRDEQCWMVKRPLAEALAK